VWGWPDESGVPVAVPGCARNKKAAPVSRSGFAQFVAEFVKTPIRFSPRFHKRGYLVISSSHTIRRQHFVSANRSWG